MTTSTSTKSKAKTAAATAAGGFFIANPLLSVFLLGAGLAIYWTMRSSRA
jgi:hypothetical protein